MTEPLTSACIHFINDPATPRVIKTDALLALSLSAYATDSSAMQAIENLLSVPEMVHLLEELTVKSLAMTKSILFIHPLSYCIEKIIDAEEKPLISRKKAVTLLTSMIGLGSIILLEKRLPALEKRIRDTQTSLQTREVSLQQLAILNTYSIAGIVTTEAIIPDLENIITNTTLNFGLRISAISVLYWTTLTGSKKAHESFKQVFSLCVDLIINSETSEEAKQKLLMPIVLELIFDKRFFTEIERLLPTIESIIFSPQFNDKTRLRAGGIAFFLTTSMQAQRIYNKFITKLVEIITGPEPDNKEKIEGGVGFFAWTPAIGATEKQNALSWLKDIANLQSFFRPSDNLDAIQRLIPVFARAACDPQTPVPEREDMLEMLVFAASKKIPGARQTLERIAPSLRDTATDPALPYAHKRGALEVLAEVTPIGIQGPPVDIGPAQNFPSVTIEEVLRAADCDPAPLPLARSLLYHRRNSNALLVVKFLRENENPASLAREAFWMLYLKKLQQEGFFGDTRFDIPEPLSLAGAYVVQVKDAPLLFPAGVALHPQRYALSFIAHPEYFSYPNDATPGRLLPAEECREILGRCALLLGKLAARGIIHTAIIPLFHNVVQQGREDTGIYRWWLGGHLHNWLQFSDYPNIGKTGIRDFEHFISWGYDPPPKGHEDPKGFFHIIGTQLLSLVIAAGSYFRNKDRTRMRFDHEGNKIDARDLFDKDLFTQMLEDILTQYYRGFTNEPPGGKVICGIDSLIEDLIKEMGTDRDNRYVVTLADQRTMDQVYFEKMLLKNGFTQEEIKNLVKGDRIFSLINVGPHLNLNFDSESNLHTLHDSVTSAAGQCVFRKFGS